MSGRVMRCEKPEVGIGEFRLLASIPENLGAFWLTLSKGGCLFDIGESVEI
jgi:hypothetical protein